MIEEQVTFVTLYKVCTFYARGHGSKYLEFHENSLPMNLSQATRASLLPRRRRRKRSVSPLPLHHLFCRNATYTSPLDQRMPKRQQPPHLPRPPWYRQEDSRISYPPGKKFSYAARGYIYPTRKAAEAVALVDAAAGEETTARPPPTPDDNVNKGL